MFKSDSAAYVAYSLLLITVSRNHWSCLFTAAIGRYGVNEKMSSRCRLFFYGKEGGSYMDSKILLISLCVFVLRLTLTIAGSQGKLYSTLKSFFFLFDHIF